MTNARRLRQDSLSQLQLEKLVEHYSSPSPVTLSPIIDFSTNRRNPLSGQQPVSPEQELRILSEASRKHSEPLPENIEEALRRFKQEQTQDATQQHESQTVEDQTVALATAEQSISEIAPSPTATTHPKKTRSAIKKKQIRSSINRASLTDKVVQTLSNPKPFLAIDTTMSRPVSLLVASLGNPPPYHSTRHSAGHILLQHLRTALNLPPLTQKSRSFGGGHVSEGQPFTLYQSAVLMNISGPPLLKAWKHFVSLHDPLGITPGLVVLHDEMEIDPARLKVKRGSNSAKGHNGLKSVQASLQGAGLLDVLGTRFVKIGVGIGRPAGGSRQSNDVSPYVLGQLTTREKDGLQNAAGELEAILHQEAARISQI